MPTRSEIYKATRRARVIVLEPLSNSLDTSTLKEHGTLTTMFGAIGCPYQTPSILQTELFCNSIWCWCEENEFDEYDVFVVSGRMAKVSVAMAVLRDYATEHDFDLNILLYDGQTAKYVKRTL